METITSPREIDALFRRGRRSRRPAVIVLCGETPPGRDAGGRVVFVAGKRLGGAVLRNRCKRVMRAAVRRSGVEWPGHDLALIATASTPNAPPEELERELVGAVREASADR